MYCRDDPKEERAGDGQADEEPQSAAIKRDFGGAWQIRDADRTQQRHSAVRDGESDRRCTEREQRAFSEQVSNDASARRAERRPDGEFPSPARDARDEQVRRVRARDEPHERDRGERQPRHRADVTHDSRAQIRHAPRRLFVLIRRAPDREDAPVDRVELVDGGRGIGIALQSSDRTKEERSFPWRRDELRGDEQLLTIFERTDTRLQHPDDEGIAAVELNRFADGVHAAAETLLPKIVADDDGRLRVGSTVGFDEIAAERRFHAEDREVRPGHGAPRQQFGGRAVGERHLTPAVGGDLFEAGLLRLQGKVVGNRKGKLVRRRVGVVPHESIRVGIRQRAQQRRVDRREDRSRRAQAEPNRQDDHRRHQRRAPQTAKPDPQVLQKIVDPQRALHAPLLLFALTKAVLACRLHVAELFQRFAAIRLGVRPTS